MKTLFRIYATTILILASVVVLFLTLLGAAIKGVSGLFSGIIQAFRDSWEIMEEKEVLQGYVAAMKRGSRK